MRYRGNRQPCRSAREWRRSSPRRRYWYPPAGRSTLSVNDLRRHPSDPPPYGSYSRVGLFPPLYNPAVEVHLGGPASSTLSLEARLSRYLSPPLFPIHLRDLPSVSCHHVPRSSFDIGPFRILTALVSHPGPTVGYRIEADGGVLCYLSDHEPALCLRNGQWPGREWVSGFDLAAETDLLIHDAQYTDEEYDRHVGWGHSSYRQAAPSPPSVPKNTLCLRAKKPKRWISRVRIRLLRRREEVYCIPS